MLPIEPILPELLSAMRSNGMAVLQAPPGAGKTTRVPAFLYENRFCKGRIIMLEPRRVAARAAAERLAQGLGEPIGQTVGYRIKGESKTGAKTRIEVVTEGILTRMIQSDPELSGIDCVIFDEFHERSLNADLGLALCLEIREALRPDLAILVMSATLDAEPVAALMGDAAVITAKGRSFPVETRWLERPWSKPGQRGPRFEHALADLVMTAANENSGGILVFLPGAGEIRRVETLLQGRIKNAEIMPLYGAMPFAKQRQVLTPLKTGRKVVLATSIAETSLTIPDIRVVVDGGKSRRARFDAGSAMSRLVTERVTKAEAEQRRGRAGRVAAGMCYRLWTKGEEGGMRSFAPAEIESTDLTALVLELALWGENDPSNLAFLTRPPKTAFKAAQTLLQLLAALDKNHRITPHGKALAALPTHPRLGQMILTGGGKQAALLAALLQNRDPLRGAPYDIGLRIDALQDLKKFQNNHAFIADRPMLANLRNEAKRFQKPLKNPASIGALLCMAFPDRIGLNRGGEAGQFLLSGGKGAIIAPGDPLANARLIVAADLDGDTREAKTRLAASISQAELLKWQAGQVSDIKLCEWSKRDRKVIARKRKMLAALILEDHNWNNAPPDMIAAAMVTGIQEMGLECLNWSKAARLMVARVEWLRARGAEISRMDPPALTETLHTWLLPYLSGCRNRADLKNLDLMPALENLLGWEGKQLLDRLAPSSILAPTGTRLMVDYSSEQPSISVRLQEMFGMTSHPTVGPDHLPLLIELLSPAQRPVQTTADLPGFWQNSYGDVRKDMRGRYPRHPWPENPEAAPPTRRVKPRR
ncbi:MAG: ATP-dependent helicase HrpB [Rhodobacteraceae bacterium]|nr:ATP-dependent helicase HrpB [Paracoccaceae bacterium]